LEDRFFSAAGFSRYSFAYDLSQVLRILEVLPLLPLAAVATAAFVSLREGELRGIQWEDYSGTEITVRRSIRKSVENQPKTPATRNSVPVKVLNEYRTSMHNPKSGLISTPATDVRWLWTSLLRR